MTVRIYQQKITHVVFIKDGQFSPTADFTPRTVFTPQGSYTPQYDYTPQADYTVQGDYTPQGDFTVQTNFKVQGDFTPQGDYSFSFDRGIGASSNFGGYGDGKYNQNDIDVDTYEALQKMREMKMREVDLAAVSAAFIVFLEKASVVWGFQAIVTHLEVQKNWMLFRKKSLELRRSQIIEATTDIESQNVWCADYTTELSGEVDSIEINGAPNQILIGPGGVNVLRDAGGGVGRLSNIMAMSSAQAALAWALLPGWQKWRPTYRVGTVSVIDYEADTATVAFAEPFSAAQNLPINQTTYLYHIPVEYMACNSAAFAVGDRVVVEFQGAQTWLSEPKVIGFESNPKPCIALSPAYHAYDYNGNWLGLLVCTSGQWGPPYQFVACAQGSVYPFEYGAWNISNDAERPINYEQREVMGGIFEVPAMHDYITGGGDFSENETITWTWLAPPYLWTVCCEDQVALLRSLRDGTYNRTLRYQCGAFVLDQHPTDNLTREQEREFNNSRPRLSEYDRVDPDQFVVGTMRGNGIYVWRGSPEHFAPACAQAQQIMGSEISVDVPAPFSDYNIPWRRLWWERDTHYLGKTNFRSYGSFVGTTADEGSYIFSCLEKDYIVSKSFLLDYFVPGQECGWTEEVWTDHEPIDNDIEKTWIYHASDEYFIDNLKAVPGSVVRIYPNEEAQSGFITLAVAKLEIGTDTYEWRYMFFDSKKQQYNDPLATFTSSGATHSLDYEVEIDGVKYDCYGNGQFSLVAPNGY